MKRFQFDPYVVLKRAREATTLPNRPNLPNRWADAPARFGRLGRLGALLAEKDKIADAVEHFEERAAIREYDGGQPRAEAELAAMIEAVRSAGVEIVDLRSAIISRRK